MTTGAERVERSAKRFYAAILPEASWDNPSPVEKRVQSLLTAAFGLYAEDWSPANIERWEWPFTTYREAKPFSGDQPWTVLLRRALELVREAKRPPVEEAERYLVTWAIDMPGPTALEAAAQAKAIQTDPESVANRFTVKDKLTGAETEIDLEPPSDPDQDYDDDGNLRA